jgi:hypothetical protein
MALRTEADVVRTLKSGSYPLSAIYAACAQAGDDVVARDGGHEKLVDYQERWQRRVRGALQTLRRAGMADAVGHGGGVRADGEPLRAGAGGELRREGRHFGCGARWRRLMFGWR